MSNPEAPILRCYICGTGFTKAENEASNEEQITRGVIPHCPVCGTYERPMNTLHDVQVSVSWHELQVLATWAEQFAFLVEHHRETLPPGLQKAIEPPRRQGDMTRFVLGISERLEQQHPEEPSITGLGQFVREAEALNGYVYRTPDGNYHMQLPGKPEIEA